MSAVPSGFQANVLGIRAEFAPPAVASAEFLPQHILVVAQGNDTATYSEEPVLLTGGQAEAAGYGYGSPMHLAVRELLPDVGPGVGPIPITLLGLPAGTTAAADLITPSGTITKSGTYHLVSGGIRLQDFQVADGATVAERVTAIVDSINNTLHSPVQASDLAGAAVALTAKASGDAGNSIVTEIVGPTDTGAVWTIDGMSGGAGNPSLGSALAKLDDTWYTAVVNTLNHTDLSALDALHAANLGRADPLVRRNFHAFTGAMKQTHASMITFGDTRRSDRTNVIVHCPTTDDLPLRAAAQAAARYVERATQNPALEYIGQELHTLRVGEAGLSPTASQRDLLVKAGICTTEVRNGKVVLSDVVTLFHPEGDAYPAYQRVSENTRLMTFLYSLELRFARAPWEGAILVAESDVVTERRARKPSSAKADVFGIVDGLVTAGVLTDPDFTKQNTTVDFVGNRVNIVSPIRLTSNGVVRDLVVPFSKNIG